MQVLDIVDVTGLGTNCIEGCIENGCVQGKNASFLFLGSKTVGLITDIITLILTFGTQQNVCNLWEKSAYYEAYELGANCDELESGCDLWDEDGIWHRCICESMQETCAHQRDGFYFLITHFCMERLLMIIIVLFIGCKNIPNFYNLSILDNKQQSDKENENRIRLKTAIWRGSLFNFTDYMAKLYEYKWNQDNVSYVFHSILYFLVNCVYFGVYFGAFANFSGMNGDSNNGVNYPGFQLFLIAMGFIFAMSGLLQSFIIIGSITNKSLSNCCGRFICGICSCFSCIIAVFTVIMMGAFLTLGNDEIS